MTKRSAARAKASWEIGGRDIVVTNLEKPFWPDDGLTKGDLLAYYGDIAPILLPYLEDRPFIMRLWPDDVGGKSFYRWRLAGALRLSAADRAANRRDAGGG
jgi:bifunctional non-homologous end joining protein LigD